MAGMNPTLKKLFDRGVAQAHDKQCFLADLVGERDWRLDLDAGTLGFGDDYAWRVQILGTESVHTRTWLWAWANEESRIPPALLEGCGRLRELGRSQGLPELTEAELPVGPEVGGHINGHTLSLIASSVLRANAYYRGPYEGGAVFALIVDPEYPPNIVDPAEQIAFRFPEVAAAYPCDHRTALAGYLSYYGLKADRRGDEWVVNGVGGPTLVANFDALGRLARIQATIEGPAAR